MLRQFLSFVYPLALIAYLLGVCAGFCAIDNYETAFKVLLGTLYVLMAVIFVALASDEVLSWADARRIQMRFKANNK